MPKAKYKNPPIEEAICQFTFSQPLPWSLDTPRQLFEKLRDRYPAMPQQQQIIQANLTPGGIEPSGLALAPTQRVVFADTENLSRFSVGPQSVGVHRAKPYIGFEEDMLPRVTEDVPSAIEFLQKNPLFANVSVRYINRIEIASTEFDLTDYFNTSDLANLLPSSFGGTVTGFFYRAAAKRSSEPLDLALNFGSVVAPKDTAAFVLDIDLVYNFDDPAAPEEAIEKIKDVKDVENSVFESLITDNTRELFQ